MSVGANGAEDRAIMKVLSGESVWPPPVWIMRQAGRYLPEYRETRARAGGFLDMCYNPDFAVEVTLQPIRRFGFDAAIMFSDILVVPHALGQNVWFAEGEGPRLDPLATIDDVARLGQRDPLEHLAPVFETLRRLRKELPAQTTLLGFCGAPWTVASYMIAGKSTPDQAPARVAAYADPAFMAALIDKLVETSIDYLVAQVDAGADALQIFESFASALSAPLFEPLSLGPIRRIVEGVKARRPRARFIVFLRGGGPNLARLVEAGFADAVALDWSLDLARVLPSLPANLPTQGNLDPLALVAGGDALDAGVDAVLSATKGRPHIFNLGHGIVPQTPVAHVERLLSRIRAA